MPTTIAENSKELVSNLIRKDFERIDLSMEYIYGKAQSLIDAAIDLGLHELAAELIQDKK